MHGASAAQPGLPVPQSTLFDGLVNQCLLWYQRTAEPCSTINPCEVRLEPLYHACLQQPSTPCPELCKNASARTGNSVCFGAAGGNERSISGGSMGASQGASATAATRPVVPFTTPVAPPERRSAPGSRPSAAHFKGPRRAPGVPPLSQQHGVRAGWQPATGAVHCRPRAGCGSGRARSASARPSCAAPGPPRPAGGRHHNGGGVAAA